MQAKALCGKLNKDFIFPGLYDEFAEFIPDMHPYMTDTFRARSMGLVCDFAKEVHKVYTAVFPSEYVMKKIFDDFFSIDPKPNGAMLFLHHPSTWGYNGKKLGWTQMGKKWVEACKEHKICIYSLHTPLEVFGNYSTGHSLVRALDMKIIEPFTRYRGGFYGVIGKTDCQTTAELSKLMSRTFGHPVKLYAYGSDIIRGGMVAVMAGSGNGVNVISRIVERGINTLLTGISVNNGDTNGIHQFEQVKGINVLGGTHYSTEKYACISMCDYFEKLGLSAEFVDDLPTMEDL